MTEAGIKNSGMKITSMKKSSLLTVFMLIGIFLASCSKNHDLPNVENITKGSKWTLKIGSTPEQVYTQLQSLSAEKNFDRVAVVYRKSYVKPEDIKGIFAYYDAITLQSSSGRVDRAVIKLDHNKVDAIEMGGSLLDSIPEWPQDYPDETAIRRDDPTGVVYEKLVKIYQSQTYQDYQIVLPDKPVNWPYDPDMANYGEWAFDFIEDLGSLRYGQHSVRLYFEHNKLIKISVRYNEGQAYN